VDGDSVATTQKALTDAEAVVRLVGPRLAAIETADGDTVEPDGTLETMPSVLFDAVVVPDGAKAAATLAALGHAREFLRDQYRHCKPMLLVGAGREVATAAGVPTDDQADWALAREVPAFIGAVGMHRNWDRATDPPRV
jgi:catalase